MDAYKDVTVQVLKCTCKKCRNIQEVYKLSDFLYGERLLLTQDGKTYAYVNCFEDAAYNEVGEIVEKILQVNNTQFQIINCFNRVFGFACDPIDNQLIDASKIKFNCENCGSDQTEVFEYQLPKTKQKGILIVSHKVWVTKSITEKTKIIQNALENEKCI